MAALGWLLNLGFAGSGVGVTSGVIIGPEIFHYPPNDGLDDVTDVVITSADSGDYIRNDGTNWVDVAISQILTDLLTVDGAASGLDADKLDGQEGTYYLASANHTGHVPDFFNGTFVESFDALVTSDGATVTMSLEQSGTGDLTMRFSDGQTTLDCTPAATIALTAGSDTSPQGNWIYVLKSTKAITKSTSAWPSAEHIKIGFFLVPSAGFVQTNGCYINQNWNDHSAGTDNQGHLSHITERIRTDGAYYFSGIDGNGVNDYLTIGVGTVDFKSTAGVAMQMHRHTVPAVDTSTGDIVLVVNWSGDAYHDITDLYDITADSTGAAINTGRWFNLVFWAVCNKGGEFAAMMCNLPSGTYNTQAQAEADASGYTDYSMPRSFDIDSSTGLLICRVTVQKQATTWGYGSNLDLRGLTAVTAASGGAGSTPNEFADNVFTIYDESDNTKEVVFQASGITTGTTRTLTVPDEDGTIVTTATANWTDLTDTGATTLHKHDHGGMDGLGDDDHTIYLLADGTRAMAGALNMNSNDIDTANAIGVGLAADSTVPFWVQISDVASSPSFSSVVAGVFEGNGASCQVHIHSNPTTGQGWLYFSDTALARGGIGYLHASDQLQLSAAGTTVVKCGSNAFSVFDASPAAQQSHVADASTSHAVADFAGTNTALDALGTKINSILATLETFGFHATS